MPHWKWLYARDFKDDFALYAYCELCLMLGFRVFVQGYSALECREYT